MKAFTTFLVASLSILSAVAQRSFIGSPANDTSIYPGQWFNVQVVKPNSLSPSTEAGLVIGILRCAQQPCPDANSQLGTIVYNGPYNPQPQQDGKIYQNFSVMAPTNLNGADFAQLSTARLYLLGAGPSPTLEVNSVPLKVIPTPF